MNDQLHDLAIWTERTYLARLQLAKRLQARGILWSAALVSASVASAIASVALLVDERIYGGKGSFVWSAAGIIILAASLIVSNADYTQRSRLAFEAYRNFQRISVLTRDANLKCSGNWRRNQAFRKLNGEYQELLDRTVNHSGADFAAAMTWRLKPRGVSVTDTASVRYVSVIELVGHWMRRVLGALVTAIPIAITLASIVALIPLARWVADAH